MKLKWLNVRSSKRFWRVLPALLAAMLALSAVPASAFNNAASREIAVSSLPVEARSILHLIKQGGPFPYPRDGVVFGNYEKRLPPHQRGYYREYTVKTPGVRSRGARRIVCGQPVECYYSDDHYRTFKLIRQ